MSVTVWTPLPELKARFPLMSEEKITQSVQNFKKYDTNKNGELDLSEVKYMLELLGETKTHVEVKQIIAEVNGGSDVISFEAFMRMVGGDGVVPNTALGRIYKSKLAAVASFHEEAIRKAAGPPAKTPEQIAEEKLERKLKASQQKAVKRSQSQNSLGDDK